MKKITLIISVLFFVSAAITLGFFYSKSIGVNKLEADSLPSILTAKDDAPRMKLPASTGDKINILFVGDMMFDRWIRQMSQKNGSDFIFQKIHDLLQKQDLVVGNLEGPITGEPSVSLASVFGSRENYIFTFPPDTAQNLYDQNIRLVNIGNNHILNFKESGLDGTENSLTGARVNFFGDAGGNGRRFFVQEVEGIKIAFVNYNQFASNGKQHALDDLQAVKKIAPDSTVVYTHWGTEFSDTPNEKDRALAHQFIDAGADLIIGSHPHVMQTKEAYQGKTIYYSLGNFIFDQYFDLRTQRGLAVQIEIDPKDGTMSVRDYSVEMKTNGQTVLK
jgi:poly-gamma-glutamate capsule biosynthesis protein CapA/YwtB (metallophosphatase superfamily)